MLAQTCPMTTLTVVNVDAMDRSAAPSVHDCRRRARIVQDRKSPVPDSVSCELAADLGPCAPYGRPPRTGREVRPPDGPTALLEAPARVSILAGRGSSDIRPKRTPGPEPVRVAG